MPTIVLDLDSSGAIRGLEKYEKEVNKAAKSTDKLTELRSKVNEFGTAFVQLATVAATAATGFAVFAVKAAADLQEASSAFDSVYDSSLQLATSLKEDLREGFAMSDQMATQAMTKFGVLGQNMGFTADISARFASEMSKLAADLSAFSNIPLADSLQALNSAFMGNYESLDKLNINITAATVAEKALAMGLAKTKGELSAKAKITATVALLEEQSAKMIGQHAKEQDSFNGLMKQAQALWADFVAMMGAYILPYATQFLKILVDWAKDQDNINRIVAGTVKVVQALYNAFKGLVLVAKTIIAAFAKMFNFIIQGIDKVTFIAQKLLEALSAIPGVDFTPLLDSFDNLRQFAEDFEQSAVQGMKRTWNETMVANQKMDKFTQGILEGKSAAELFGATATKAMNDTADAAERTASITQLVNDLAKQSADITQRAGAIGSAAYQNMSKAISGTKNSVDQTISSQNNLTGAVNNTASAYNTMAGAANAAAAAVNAANAAASKTSTYRNQKQSWDLMSESDREKYQTYLNNEMLQMVRETNKIGFLPFGEGGRDKFAQMPEYMFITDPAKQLEAYQRWFNEQMGITSTQTPQGGTTPGGVNIFVDNNYSKSDIADIARKLELNQQRA